VSLRALRKSTCVVIVAASPLPLNSDVTHLASELDLDLTTEAGPRHQHWHGVCFLRLPWPTLEHAPVSPVSSAPGCRLTGTGYTHIIHAHLSVVGDASAEPLSEDPCCRLRVPLG
jgi:hypothetical protein